MKPIPLLLMTGWRARVACQHIANRANAMRRGLRSVERASNLDLLAVMQLEAAR